MKPLGVLLRCGLISTTRRLPVRSSAGCSKVWGSKMWEQILDVRILIYYYHLLPTDAVCCPDILIENVVLSNI